MKKIKQLLDNPSLELKLFALLGILVGICLGMLVMVFILNLR